MERLDQNPFETETRAAVAFGLSPLGTRVATAMQAGAPSELRRAAFTLALALYPLVGSVTIVLAAILLAGGANAG